MAESFGGWHSGAVKEVKKLGAALAMHTGQEEAEAISHLWGRLGILLQQGNEVILGNRVPALPDAHINGVFWSVTFFRILFQTCTIHVTASP